MIVLTTMVKTSATKRFGAIVSFLRNAQTLKDLRQRRDSCDIISGKTVRRRVVQTSSRVMCDSCRRAVSAVQGCW